MIRVCFFVVGKVMGVGGFGGLGIICYVCFQFVLWRRHVLLPLVLQTVIACVVKSGYENRKETYFGG